MDKHYGQYRKIDVEDIVKKYKAGASSTEIAIEYAVPTDKIIRILVTVDEYRSTAYRDIKEMRNRGITDEEIAKRLGMTEKNFRRYVPYSDSLYKKMTSGSEEKASS